MRQRAPQRARKKIAIRRNASTPSDARACLEEAGLKCSSTLRARFRQRHETSGKAPTQPSLHHGGCIRDRLNGAGGVERLA